MSEIVDPEGMLCADLVANRAERIAELAATFDASDSAEVRLAIENAAYQGAEAAVEALAEAGVKLSYPRILEDGTPIVTAVERGSTRLVAALIVLGCDPSYPRLEDANGAEPEFPLSLALARDDIDMVRALLDGGADPNADGSTMADDGDDDDYDLVDLYGTRCWPSFNCRSAEAVDLLRTHGATFEPPQSGAPLRDSEPSTPAVAAALRGDWDAFDRFVALSIGLDKRGLAAARVQALVVGDEPADQRLLPLADTPSAAQLERGLGRALTNGDPEAVARLIGAGARLTNSLTLLTSAQRAHLIRRGAIALPPPSDLAAGG